MLQQTREKTVIPYYQRWLEAFSNIQALSRANLQTVLEVWEGLGYYVRARNLHKTSFLAITLSSLSSRTLKSTSHAWKF